MVVAFSCCLNVAIQKYNELIVEIHITKNIEKVHVYCKLFFAEI